MVATALFVNAVAEGLRDKLGIIDSVAGVDSLVLRFDPGKVSPEGARNLLNDDLSAVSVTGRPVSERMTIPVCYGGAHGPDFDNLCTQLGVSPDSLIELHSAQIYRVLTIGFAPGVKTNGVGACGLNRRFGVRPINAQPPGEASG
ncbi:MAG: carboxyltransferase domain-containing protein [Pseudomonadota bacterium]